MVYRRQFLRLFFSLVVWPTVGWCDESILQKLPAEQIQEGCNLEFYILPDENPALGRPDHSIDLRWVCGDQPQRVIDNYEIEGGSPDIVTVFYRKRHDAIVLVKWSTNSQAADVQGDYYKIYVYRYARNNPAQPFRPQRDVMKKLGEGWDGTVDGKSVHYPYKDALSIRKALNRLGY
ncbi:hypothetical protein [Caballeronia sordidicola]|jgi:hypothetical protein|uniref:hypothetical protein n=1 Tax=Caballeronia sordidicola TaxID=196367 RepID=UPI000B77278A|nr:hypothetical protein [Caballeronia sordidicola]